MLGLSALFFVFFLIVGASFLGVLAILAIRRRVADLEHRIQQLDANIRDLRTDLAAKREQVVARQSPVPPPQPAVAAPAVPVPPLCPAMDEPRPAVLSVPVVTVSRQPQPKHHESSLESIEKLVGTRWLNWVGALVVLVGIAFLLKFLYDRGWIGPAGRVGIGLAFGVGLLFVGETRLRRVHDLLSQSVSAAGCGALFLTTFLAFKFYDFSGRLPTFLLLCWFAGFTVTLAVVRNGRILAYLGLLGAYLTPYLLSTGEDRAESLFSYLAILALAAAFVVAARGWTGIPSFCVGFSWLYYAGWYSRFFSNERLLVAVVGAGGLIVLLGGLGLVRGLWNRSPVSTEECVVLVGSGLAGLYYLWEVLAPEHPAALGIVLCGLAVAWLLSLRTSRLRQASHATLESTLLGLASGSLILVIPACLESSGAMVAWALAAVVLADIGSRSRRWVLEVAAGISLVAGLMVGFGTPVHHSGVFHPILNRVFAAWFCAIVAWFIVGFRFARVYQGDASRRLIAATLQIASCFMMLVLLSYETVAWFTGRLSLPGVNAGWLQEWRTAALCLLWALYPAAWLRWAKVQPRLWDLGAVHYAVMSLPLLALLTDFHHREVLLFLNPAFLAALLFPAGMFLVSRQIGTGKRQFGIGLQLYGHILFVILLSAELYQGLFLPAEYAASRHWIRMALISAGWALYASAVLVIGISRNLAAWRWLALSLLGVTLLKVFLVDMAEVRQIWRVLSFLVLGVLLMACSYAYTRLERKKKLEDQPAEKEVTP